jgi:hypothetical protein
MTEIEKKSLTECLNLVSELAFQVAGLNQDQREAFDQCHRLSNIAGGLADVLRGADTIGADMVLRKWGQLGR